MVLEYSEGNARRPVLSPSTNRRELCDVRSPPWQLRGGRFRGVIVGGDRWAAKRPAARRFAVCGGPGDRDDRLPADNRSQRVVGECCHQKPDVIAGPGRSACRSPPETGPAEAVVVGVLGVQLLRAVAPVASRGYRRSHHRAERGRRRGGRASVWGEFGANGQNRTADPLSTNPSAIEAPRCKV